MKTALIGAVTLVVLMIGAQSAYGAPAFQTGFNYGVQDASFPPNVLHGFGGGPNYYGAYINQTGKGFDQHSDAFNEGYLRGWCEVMGYNATLYPHSNALAPDVPCRDVLGMSLIFSLEKKDSIVPSGKN